MRGDIVALGPAEYVGIDIRPGPGVDVLCEAGDLVERFGGNAFDLVSTRSYGVDFHRRSFDDWRFMH